MEKLINLLPNLAQFVPPSNKAQQNTLNNSLIKGSLYDTIIIIIIIIQLLLFSRRAPLGGLPPSSSPDTPQGHTRGHALGRPNSQSDTPTRSKWVALFCKHLRPFARPATRPNCP